MKIQMEPKCSAMVLKAISVSCDLQWQKKAERSTLAIFCKKQQQQFHERTLIERGQFDRKPAKKKEDEKTLYENKFCS